MSEVETVTEPPLAPQYVGRLGVLLLAVPAQDGSNGPRSNLKTNEQHYTELVTALKNDPRVRELRAPAAQDNTFRNESFSFAGSPSKNAPVMPALPHRHVHVASFVNPILLKVHVPTRLQPQERGESGIPSEEYWLSWDGVELLVIWAMEDSESPTGHFGGYAAIEILQDAAKAIKLRAIKQPCGPYCSYPFTHRDLFVAPDPHLKQTRVTERTRNSVLVAAKSETDPLELIRVLSSNFSFATHTFARLRSHGASIWQTEKLARSDLTKLLAMQYQRAKISSTPFFKSLPARWKHRSMTKQMTMIIAGLWLRLATLEENRRQWSEGRYVYDTGAHRFGSNLIFSIEYPQAINSVESLETKNLSASVEQLSIRGDSRLIAFATTAGAVAGALAAGLLSLAAAALNALE